jgi:hypothetical protein
LGTFDPAQVISQLGSAYMGNPNNGLDGSEKFAYLNIIGTGGTTFDKVLFLNATTGTGFEADNFSVRATAVPLAYPGTSISGAFFATPEPSSLILVTLGLLGGLVARRRSSPRASA